MERIQGLPSSTNPHSPHILVSPQSKGRELAVIPDPELEPPLIELLSFVLRKSKNKRPQLKIPNVAKSPMQRQTTRSITKQFIKRSNLSLNVQPSIFVDI